MVRPLSEILEREFSLKQNGGFSIGEIRNMDVRKIMWFYERLIKQRMDQGAGQEKN
jgi:hypothetical protein